MKKIILLLLLLPFVTNAQESRIGKVAQSITEAKAISGEFQVVNFFNSEVKSATTNYSNAVSDGNILTINQVLLDEINNEKPKQIQLSIPINSQGKTLQLDLVQAEVFAPGFKAKLDTGEDITNQVDFGRHYRGIIAGNERSLVSISIFKDQIHGLIASDEGNYTLAKLRDSDTNHIIYKDTDLKSTYEFLCNTEDDGVGYTTEEISNPAPQDPGDEVDIYIEAGQSVFNANGGNLSNTVAFLTSLFAQSYILYANDGILARTSNMLVWVNPDPYNGSNSDQQLSKFAAQTDELNGDLGHLVELQNYGGLASGFQGICPSNSDISLCYSGLIGLNVPNVPVYSWNVMVVTHEMGHLMGSRHTHACVWNGNNTAIDSCAGFTEGNCTLPGIPSNGGTIMSYCHLQSVGINFNLGFGPQPTAVILNNINATGNCLDDEGSSNPPVAVCKTHQVTLDTNGVATIVAQDVEGGSYDDGTIVSYEIDQDTFGCEDVGFHPVTLTVTDNNGLTSQCVSYVEVIDDTEISVAGCPNTIVVEIPEGTTYELLNYQDDIEVTTDICTVEVAATSQNPSPGTQLPEGEHEITLSALLNDGTVVSCTFTVKVEFILGIGDNSILSSLSMYPNPTVNTVHLNNPENLELESIAVYDMLGRFIKDLDLRDMGTVESIDVSDLSPSSYIVIIQGEQDKLVKQLIIK